MCKERKKCVVKNYPFFYLSEEQGLRLTEINLQVGLRLYYSLKLVVVLLLYYYCSRVGIIFFINFTVLLFIINRRTIIYTYYVVQDPTLGKKKIF